MQRFGSFQTPVLHLVHAFYVLLYNKSYLFCMFAFCINMQTAHQSLGDLRRYVGLKFVNEM